ncbi:MAG: DUF3016 domain-containing protein [Pseudaminobacter sp.]
MPMTRIAAVALGALIVMTAAAQAAVTVNFVQPERFTDEDFRSSIKRDGIVKEFDRYFHRLDKRYLKDGQTLEIDVLNIDLAGQYEPWQQRFYDVRIMRDITPPRFKLRYTLRQAGKVLISGTENITDMTYLWNPSARLSGERFAYEKEMLRDWFRDRFVKLKAPRA